MRAYFFGNMYLSSIQQGIQAAHATAEIYNKYFPEPAHTGEYCFHATEQSTMLADWAQNHKTMILLNAGYGETIHELVKFFGSRSNSFPWAPFYEGKDSLDGAITTVGIILPERIYGMASLVRDCNSPDATIDHLMHYGQWDEWSFNKWEVQLIERMNRFGMAS